jgi:hypothetical protein
MRRTELTSEWKARAREAIRRSGKNAKEIAKEMKLSDGVLNHMLDERYAQQTSSHAIELSRILGIAPPTVEVGSPDAAEWLDLHERIAGRSPERAAQLLGIARQVAAALDAYAAGEQAIEKTDEAVRKELLSMFAPPKKP